MKRILVTRPRTQADQFSARLNAAGFEAISFPVIEIQKIMDNPDLARAISQLDWYDWIVFTSANGVEAFCGQMKTQGVEQIPGNVRVAAIGPKTAEVLVTDGIIPSFTAEEYVSEAILPGLGDLRGRRVLLPRAEIARKALPEAIVSAGGEVHEIVVYRTLPAEVDAEGLAALKAGVDVVTFTSASTVQNFIQILRKIGIDPFKLPAAPKIACIGPVTAKTAKDEGFEVAIIAQNYTTEGLVEAIQYCENLC